MEKTQVLEIDNYNFQEYKAGTHNHDGDGDYINLTRRQIYMSKNILRRIGRKDGTLYFSLKYDMGNIALAIRVDNEFMEGKNLKAVKGLGSCAIGKILPLGKYFFKEKIDDFYILIHKSKLT